MNVYEITFWVVIVLVWMVMVGVQVYETGYESGERAGRKLGCRCRREGGCPCERKEER